ncbi:MAG: hypothetical protein Q4C64_06730 [Erysipelotrichia bacterium]|nr:hypothetical protein [Erysipelotrichia bacterium]
MTTKEKPDFKRFADGVKKATKDAANTVSITVKNTLDKTEKNIVNAIDQNGNGEIDIEDLIIAGLKTPGVRVNREKFLRKELENRCSLEVVEKSIIFNPIQADVPLEIINKIADDVITYERYLVTGVATALGIPGGLGMVLTVPADIVQYYAHMLIVIQKLMYLYGFPQIDLEDKEVIFDSKTMNVIVVCFGVMYGVAGANKALKVMANALAKGVEKKLLNKAITKGFIFKTVKKIATWFSTEQFTKPVFAGFFKKAIPLVGGFVGGGITYFSFKPCCDRLKESLSDTMLSNPNHKLSLEEKQAELEIING